MYHRKPFKAIYRMQEYVVDDVEKIKKSTEIQNNVLAWNPVTRASEILRNRTSFNRLP